MSGNKNVVGWDTGIFIAWLTDEKRNANEIIGIEEQIELFNSGQLIITASTLIFTEISANRLLKQHLDKLDKFTQTSRNFVLTDVTKRIAKLAGEIQDYYRHLEDGVDAPILTPDAIHLATAINNQCSHFYTFDEKNRVGKSRGLVPLSPLIAKRYNLIIEKPFPSPNYQHRMFGPGDYKNKP
jgi:predicted nucleic acid-binding protein